MENSFEVLKDILVKRAMDNANGQLDNIVGYSIICHRQIIFMSDVYDLIVKEYDKAVCRMSDAGMIDEDESSCLLGYLTHALWDRVIAYGIVNNITILQIDEYKNLFN